MKAIAWQEARMEGSRSLVVAVALSALLLVAILVLGAPAGQKAYAANNTLSTGTVTTQAAADAKSVLLAKDGKFYNCTSKGVKVGSVWSSANRSKVTTLFVAADVKKVPTSFKFKEGSASGGMKSKGATGTIVSIQLPKLKTTTFLLGKNGKNACTSIAANALDYTYEMTAVKNFNKTSVTSIGKEAFCYSNLKTISLPSTLKTMGASAFAANHLLTTVTGMSKTKLTAVPDSAFGNCKSLKSIALPATCKTIGLAAFGTCSKLTSVTLGSKTTSIGSVAFNSCSSLTSITLPASVKKIGEMAFWKCTKLKKLTMRSTTVVSTSSGDSDLLSDTPIAKSSAKAYIYVPKSVLAKYKAVGKSSGWYGYRSKFKAI